VLSYGKAINASEEQEQRTNMKQAGSLRVLMLYSEDGNYIFLLNGGWLSPQYMPVYPVRYKSSQLSLWKLKSNNKLFFLLRNSTIVQRANYLRTKKKKRKSVGCEVESVT
jgi:hypothetical protein